MARIKDTTVDAVRASADFVSIVEERTPLRRSGARMVARCPFHDEHTPSFSINPVDKLYYCHGCHKGGDMIGFVRDTQGLSFVEAVEWLAARAGITPEYEEGSPADDLRRKRRERLTSLLDRAASFYEGYLWESPSGSLARDYLAGRGLGEEICRDFRLGLALGGTTLTRKALDQGFTMEELRAAGLTRARGGDYFERRLVFPLSDARGRVLGFQARRLHDNDPLQAKYVNTAESELFTKGAVVYGLDKARTAISKQDRACVVEGNTDVIALRQAGFEPVVACMGTALTEHQLRELARLTKRLWLAFDGDAAGQAATLRGMDLAVAQGFDVKVVPLPPGKDPADEPDEFEARLASAKPYDLHVAQALAQRADDKEAGRRQVESFLSGRPDSLDRRAAQQWANDHFGMNVHVRGGGTQTRTAAPSPRLVAAVDRVERGALAGVIAHRELTAILASISPEHFRDETNRALRAYLVDGTPADESVLERLAELDAWVPEQNLDNKATAEEYLLRLTLREVDAELANAELERVRELHEKRERIEQAIETLRLQTAAPG
jgi:DNA primase